MDPAIIQPTVRETQRGLMFKQQAYNTLYYNLYSTRIVNKHDLLTLFSGIKSVSTKVQILHFGSSTKRNYV